MAGEGDPARAPDADISWSCLGSATHTAPAHTSKCPLTTTVNHSNSRFPLHSLNGTADALRLSDIGRCVPYQVRDIDSCTSGIWYCHPSAMSLQEFTGWGKWLVLPEKKILIRSGKELWTFTPAPRRRHAALLTSEGHSSPRGKTGGWAAAVFSKDRPMWTSGLPEGTWW